MTYTSSMRLEQLVHPTVCLHVVVQMRRGLLLYHLPALWMIPSWRLGMYKHPGNDHMKTVILCRLILDSCLGHLWGRHIPQPLWASSCSSRACEKARPMWLKWNNIRKLPMQRCVDGGAHFITVTLSKSASKLGGKALVLCSSWPSCTQALTT